MRYQHFYEISGKQDESGSVPACQALSQLIRLCRDPATADLDLNIQPFDPAGEVEVPTLTLKHDPQLDTAMELWAQGQTGYTKVKRELINRLTHLALVMPRNVD